MSIQPCTHLVESLKANNINFSEYDPKLIEFESAVKLDVIMPKPNLSMCVFICDQGENPNMDRYYVCVMNSQAAYHSLGKNDPASVIKHVKALVSGLVKI